MANNDKHPLALVEIKDGYAIVTINRAEKRNSMSRQAQADLVAALAEVKEAGSKVVVLTGAGDQSFCSGVDVKEAMEQPDPNPRQYAHGSQSWANVQDVIARHPAVFVAAVNGYALGGGLTLAHNCDLAVASESATFGLPEVTFGVYAGLAGPATACRVLPKDNAWLTLTGERIDAKRAKEMGIVNEVVPPAKLMERAEQIAQMIAKYDAVALDYCKKAVRAVQELGWDDGIEYGHLVNSQLAQAKQRTKKS